MPPKQDGTQLFSVFITHYIAKFWMCKMMILSRKKYVTFSIALC